MHSREEKAALERLADDLRRIRAESEKTLTEVHEDTRIPLEVLRRLESDLLSGDKMFNDVYLRSILRSFAGAIDWREDVLLDAFEAASRGDYGEHNRIVNNDSGVSAEPAPTVADETRVEESNSPESSSVVESPAEEPSESAATRDRPPIARDDGKRKKRFVMPRFDFRKGGIGILVLAAVLTGIFAVGKATRPGGSNMNAAVVPADSSPPQLIPGAPDGSASEDAAPEAAKEPFSMPDMIRVSIYATSGDFNPIRVRVDRDLRRPYWADSTDTLHFTFENRIILEEAVERIGVSVEGLQYPAESRSTQTLIITRDRVRQFLESQHGSGR